MAFEVGVVAHFGASHHLVGNFGPASEPHAHAYRVEAVVSGQRLQSDGTLFDITILQTALDQAISRLDGTNLNTLAEFATVNPTAEQVAQHLFDVVAPRLPALLASLTVRVWESETAFAAYAGEPATSAR